MIRFRRCEGEKRGCVHDERGVGLAVKCGFFEGRVKVTWDFAYGQDGSKAPQAWQRRYSESQGWNLRGKAG